MSAIPDTLPKDVRQVFENKLSFLNRFSLKTRLDKLLYARGIHSVKVSLVQDLNTSKRSAFYTRAEMAKALNKVTRLITDTRNYLTHYDENQRSRALTPAEIVEINPKLQLWLTTMLLDDAEIDDGTIANAVEKFIEKNFVTVLRH